jgi:hypothetical protein
MAVHVRSSAPFFAMCLLAVLYAGVARGQVFTVGEQSATADIRTDFKPTHVDLPGDRMTELNERDLVRNFADDQGFARRPLPLGSVVYLEANGNLTPGGDQYRKLIYKKGEAAAAGDRVAVTSIKFKGNQIQIDVNGGPYPKHRFLQHVQVGVGNVGSSPQPLTSATGLRITLVFEGGTPAVTAPQVQALLAPLIDFSAKTGEIVYADTMPTPIRSAIASHEVLVGMSHRMVIAALGQPASKVREGTGDQRYEEWIYGHQPETVRFVRFVGDRVTRVEIAAMGKPLDLHEHDEMEGYSVPENTHTVVVADGPASVPGNGSGSKAAPPTLRKPGEPSVGERSGDSEHRVKFPDQQPVRAPVSTTPSPPVPSVGTPSPE